MAESNLHVGHQERDVTGGINPSLNSIAHIASSERIITQNTSAIIGNACLFRHTTYIMTIRCEFMMIPSIEQPKRRLYSLSSTAAMIHIQQKEALVQLTRRLYPLPFNDGRTTKHEAICNAPLSFAAANDSSWAKRILLLLQETFICGKISPDQGHDLKPQHITPFLTESCQQNDVTLPAHRSSLLLYQRLLDKLLEPGVK